MSNQIVFISGSTVHKTNTERLIYIEEIDKNCKSKFKKQCISLD